MKNSLRFCVTLKSEELISKLIGEMDKLARMLATHENSEFLEKNPEISEALLSMADTGIEYYEEVNKTSYPMKTNYNLILNTPPSKN